MEVFIRGVPKRETEKSLHDFFKNVLCRLQIEDWICQKISQKGLAKLIFLNAEDGQRFLSLHGQTKNLAGRFVLFPDSTNLMFKGNPLYCSLSDRMDKFALQSLEMNKKARAEHKLTLAKSDVSHSGKDYRTLPCTSISCGLWDYRESELIFKPYSTLTESATITFNAKFIAFKMQTGQRLDISYYGIEAVAWEGLPVPAITFTLREAPRFFQSLVPMTSNLPNDFASMLESIFRDRDLHDNKGPNRERLPGLNEDHQKISGSCLVYRLLLTNSRELDNQIRALGQTRGMPPMIRRHIKVRQPKETYTAQFRRLRQLLSPTATATDLPFSITFQLQKLAQNGYLPPSKVIALLPEIKNMFLRSDRRVCVNAIRKLFLQIPFPGPDTEPECFKLQTLVNWLRKNEQQSKRDGLYLEEPVGSENVAVIHKATVTPAGIYLYGPDLESNNRVLRKYSAHHDCFLRVQFSDEDGLPVFFNLGTSNEAIYDRFRKVLNEGFPIAGQHFSFLGFSHSSLRAQSCWFMTPFSHNGRLLSDRELIKGLGNFSKICIPARCAARIGQAFSDTRDAIALAPGVVKEMEDVERNGRVFSDGVGTISMETLEQIWGGLLAGKQKKPTVLQIRYQGKCVYRVDDVTMLHTSIVVSFYFNFYCICLEYFPLLFCSPSEYAPLPSTL
jgi:RNA dependent RNA polymerase